MVGGGVVLVGMVGFGVVMGGERVVREMRGMGEGWWFLGGGRGESDGGSSGVGRGGGGEELG